MVIEYTDSCGQPGSGSVSQHLTPDGKENESPCNSEEKKSQSLSTHKQALVHQFQVEQFVQENQS